MTDLDQLDEIDRRLLRALQADAGQSQAALAEQVGASAASVWRRVKALEEAGVLKGAVRLVDPVLAVKEKLTTPLVMPLMVSHGWSLVGANGASRFSVAGNTTGKASLPAASPSNLALGSTKARGTSLIASELKSGM